MPEARCAGRVRRATARRAGQVRARPPGRPRAELAQAVADRLAGDRPRAARRPRAGRRRARGGPRAPRSACSPSRARRRRDGARPGSSIEPLAVEEDVGRLVAVAAGDDDRARAERVERARELLGRRGPARRRRAPAPRGGSGVITVARGSSSSTSAARASVVEQHARRTRRPSPGRCTTGVPGRAGRAPRRPPRPSRRVAEHPDLHGVDADVLGHRADLRDDHRRARRLHRVDADGVLRGQRGDRRHPVDAAARERLQVGLDAGAAAGVRAGDREDDAGCGSLRRSRAAQDRTAVASPSRRHDVAPADSRRTSPSSSSSASAASVPPCLVRRRRARRACRARADRLEQRRERGSSRGRAGRAARDVGAGAEQRRRARPRRRGRARRRRAAARSCPRRERATSPARARRRRRGRGRRRSRR